MNEKQFEIVKIMQKIGISSRRFATACRVAHPLMAKAYSASNFERFQDDPALQQIFG